MKLWAGQTVSQFGAQITLVAFPLTAVVVLHATALQMGELEALAMAPFLVVGLPVGVWVDRMARRPLLVRADVTRLALVGLVPVLYLTHHLTSMLVLDVIQFVAGCMTVLLDVAYQSYLPAVVGTDALVDGNSRREASRAVSQVVGPSLGGALAAAFTAPRALCAHALTYLVSVVSLLSMHAAKAPPPRQAGRSMAREMAIGLRAVLKNPVLASIAGCTGTSNFSPASRWRCSCCTRCTSSA
jgi:MFS family permease